MLDFDHAVLDFWEWFEAKQEEQIPVSEGTQPKLRKGQTWGRKYRSYNDIFDLYGKAPEQIVQLDPEVQAVDIEALLRGDDDDD